MGSWIWQSRQRSPDFQQNTADSARVSNSPTELSHWATEGRETEFLPILKLQVTSTIECVPGFPKTIMVCLEVLWACEYAKGETFFQKRMFASSSVPCGFKITTTLWCMARRGAMLAFGPWKTSTCLQRRGLCLPNLWHLCGIFSQKVRQAAFLKLPIWYKQVVSGFLMGWFEMERINAARSWLLPKTERWDISELCEDPGPFPGLEKQNWRVQASWCAIWGKMEGCL